MVSLLVHQVVFHFRQHRRPAAFSKFFFLLPAPTELRHHLRFLIPLPLLHSRITSHPIFAAVSAENLLSYPHDTWINYTRNLHLAKPIANLRSRPSFHAPSFRPPRRSLPRVHCNQKGTRAAKGHCLFGRCLGSNPDAPHRTAPHRPDTYTLLYTSHTLSCLLRFLSSFPPDPIPRPRLEAFDHHPRPSSSIDLRRGPNPCSATLGRYRRQIEILVSPPSNPLHPESARIISHLANITLTLSPRPAIHRPQTINYTSKVLQFYISTTLCARAISIDLDSHRIHTL